MSGLFALQRYTSAARRAREGMRCELCGLVITSPHRHVVDVDQQRLLCACMACALVFTDGREASGSSPGATDRRWRSVPERVRADPEWSMSERELTVLGVPVGLAFFFRSSRRARVTAVFPSPCPRTASLVRALPPLSAGRGRTHRGSMKVLVAGVGNIFFGDDGFGVEVAQRLAARPLPQGTAVVDYGVRSMHLAFELLTPPDLLVLVDAASRNGTPGTLYVIEPDEPAPATAPDAHSVDPNAVLQTVRALGGTPPRTRIVGCAPACLSERIGLSEPVERAVEPAISMIRRLIESEVDDEDQS